MKRPPSTTALLIDVLDVVAHLNRKLMALSPITRADVDELAIQLSAATTRIDRTAERWYELGKRERALFGEPTTGEQELFGETRPPR
jgi:hypothetical protein